MTAFSSNLKYLREEHKLSQQQIADSIGIKQRTYSDYENGKTEPGVEVLTKLARFFKVSLDYIVGYTILEPVDREIAKNLNISNAELAERVFAQGFEIAKNKVLKKEPNLFDKEIINAYKEREQA